MIVKRLNGSISLQPHETRADLPICPYRIDWIQSECYNCDLCGRNEAQEHGVIFETENINGFKWFKDELKNTEKAGIIQYGNKLLDFNYDNLILYQEGNNNTLKNIGDELRKYGFFIIRSNDKKLYQLTRDHKIKEYTCTELCDYLKDKNFHKDILEIIQRGDNIVTIAEFLPILY